MTATPKLTRLNAHPWFMRHPDLSRTNNFLGRRERTPMMNLTGKVAIVTGASSGIGDALAKRLLSLALIPDTVTEAIRIAARTR